MLSIADVKRSEISLHWHEAVAIVADVAAVLLDQQLSSVPAPESILLAPEGTLHAVDAGVPDATPGRRLGELLDFVLASVACPPELRQLAADSVGDPPAYPTVAAFADALAFFERPGRRELLKALAARASDAVLQARANAELDRLQARTRHAQPDVDQRVERAPSRGRRTARVFAASVVALGVIAGAILALLVANPARATIAARARAHVDAIAQKGLEVIGIRTRDALPAAPAVAASPPVVRKVPRRVPRARPLAISLEQIESRPVAAGAWISAPASLERIAPDDTIYSDDEEGVEPAVLVRPHLPNRPLSTEELSEVGVLEIVVSPKGTVDRVRLISPGNRYHDRMIVAAAKAWQFKPAMKDGRTVRYRMRILLTL